MTKRKPKELNQLWKKWLAALPTECSGPLHYVPSADWQEGIAISGYRAACGSRVLPLWGQLDETILARGFCPECIDARQHLTNGDKATPLPTLPD